MSCTCKEAPAHAPTSRLPAEDGATGEILFEGETRFRFRTGTLAQKLWELQFVGETGTIVATPKQLSLNGSPVSLPAVDENDGRYRQFSEFLQWVKGERPNYTADGQQAALSTELILAAYDAARLGQSVALPLANRGEVITKLYPDAGSDFIAEPPSPSAALGDRRLAINGGPRSIEKWFVTGAQTGLSELVGVAKVVLSGSMNSLGGTVVSSLESAFAKAYGSPQAVASTSGTAALHVALAAVNPEPGEEVITTPMTDMGSVIPILWSGCIPVFADIDPLTGNCTVETIAARITPRTRAVILVHLFGRPADPGPVAELCRRHGIVLIEDCAQAHFAESQGKKVGTFGALGCFSLQQSKQITCGDGGITLVNDSQYAHRAALFVDKAWNRKSGMRAHEFLGMNYRMTELQAAVALAQLQRLPGFMEIRRRTAERLVRKLEGVAGLRLPPSNDANPAWWKFNFAVEPSELGVTANEFAGALLAEGVRCQNQYLPRPLFEEDVIRDQKTFGKSRYPFSLVDYRLPQMEDFPGYEAFSQRQIIMSWGTRIKDQHIDGIAGAVCKIVGIASAGRDCIRSPLEMATVAEVHWKRESPAGESQLSGVKEH